MRKNVGKMGTESGILIRVVYGKAALTVLMICHDFFLFKVGRNRP